MKEQYRDLEFSIEARDHYFILKEGVLSILRSEFHTKAVALSTLISLFHTKTGVLSILRSEFHTKTAA